MAVGKNARPTKGLTKAAKSAPPTESKAAPKTAGKTTPKTTPKASQKEPAKDKAAPGPAKPDKGPAAGAATAKSDKGPATGATPAKPDKGPATGATPAKPDKAAAKGGPVKDDDAGGAKPGGGPEQDKKPEQAKAEGGKGHDPAQGQGGFSPLDFLKKLYLPIVIKLNNLTNWIFSKDCTWRQILVIAVILYFTVNFLIWVLKGSYHDLLKIKIFRRVKRKFDQMLSCIKSVIGCILPCCRSKTPKKEVVYHHIAFLPNASSPEPNSKDSGQDSLFGNAGFQLLKTCINEAEYSVDMCVFLLTSDEIIDLLLDATSRGVIVRLITDSETAAQNCESFERLKHGGCQVFLKKSPYLMHHKFAIIDEKCLINSSFNWNRQGLLGNKENVLVTNEPAIVLPYYKEFKRLRHYVASQASCYSATPILPHEHSYENSTDFTRAKNAFY